MRHWALLLEAGLLRSLEELRSRVVQMLPRIPDGRGNMLAAIPHPGSGEAGAAVWRDFLTTLRNEDLVGQEAHTDTQTQGRSCCRCSC